MPPRRYQARSDSSETQMYAPVRQAFNLTIPTFEGEPSMLDHFFSLLADLQKYNNYTNDQILATMRSKLAGNALKYFTESPEFKNIATLEQAKNIFKGFFCSSSTFVSISEFQNIKLGLSETIKSLAHRIDIAASRVYPDMEISSLQKIKLTQLLNSLPPEIRYKISEQEINNYSEAVKYAQKIQDAKISAYIDTNSTAVSNEYMNQLKTLQEQINNIQTQQNCQLCDNAGHIAKHCPKLTEHKQFPSSSSSHPYPRQQRYFYNQNTPQKHAYKNITCQFCSKYGHTVHQCRQHKALLQNSNINEDNKQRTFPKSRYFNNRYSRNNNRGLNK